MPQHVYYKSHYIESSWDFVTMHPPPWAPPACQFRAACARGRCRRSRCRGSASPAIFLKKKSSQNNVSQKICNICRNSSTSSNVLYIVTFIVNMLGHWIFFLSSVSLQCPTISQPKKNLWRESEFLNQCTSVFTVQSHCILTFENTLFYCWYKVLLYKVTTPEWNSI